MTGIGSSPTQKLYGSQTTTGNLHTINCALCNLTGYQESPRQLDIKVPPGAFTGASILHKGQGHFQGVTWNASPPSSSNRINGSYGDLIVQFEVEDHPFLIREKQNVRCSLPISFPQAILGVTLQIPTIYGHAKVGCLLLLLYFQNLITSTN